MEWVLRGLVGSVWVSSLVLASPPPLPTVGSPVTSPVKEVRPVAGQAFSYEFSMPVPAEATSRCAGGRLAVEGLEVLFAQATGDVDRVTVTFSTACQLFVPTLFTERSFEKRQRLVPSLERDGNALRSSISVTVPVGTTGLVATFEALASVVLHFDLATGALEWRDRDGRVVEHVAGAKSQHQPTPARAALAAANEQTNTLTDDDLRKFLGWACEELALTSKRLNEALALEPGNVAALTAFTAESQRLRADLHARQPAGPAFVTFQKVVPLLYERAHGRLIIAHHDELQWLRNSAQATLTEQVIAHEDTIVSTLSSCLFIPPAQHTHARVEQPDDIVSKSSAVRLSMSPQEVAAVLGAPLEQRRQGTRLQTSYRVEGHSPGNAWLTFVGDSLIDASFVRDRRQAGSMPRLTRASLVNFNALEIKAIKHVLGQAPLMLDEVFRETRGAGQRLGFRLFEDAQGHTVTSTLWGWQVSPNEQVLLVTEVDGVANQPLLRPSKDPWPLTW